MQVLACNLILDPLPTYKVPQTSLETKDLPNFVLLKAERQIYLTCLSFTVIVKHLFILTYFSVLSAALKFK